MGRQQRQVSYHSKDRYRITTCSQTHQDHAVTALPDDTQGGTKGGKQRQKEKANANEWAHSDLAVLFLAPRSFAATAADELHAATCGHNTDIFNLQVCALPASTQRHSSPLAVQYILSLHIQAKLTHPTY